MDSSDLSISGGLILKCGQEYVGSTWFFMKSYYRDFTLLQKLKFERIAE